MRFHKPVPVPPESIDSSAVAPDALEAVEMAHRTAAVLVGRGRESQDPQVRARLVDLPRTVGLSTLAEVWADRPARTLPGALWRLYALHEWVHRAPRSVAEAFTAGASRAEVYRVISGVVEPPGPTELHELTNEILTGVYEGDLAVALERAAAFCHVTATGLAVLHEDRADADRALDGDSDSDAANDETTDAALRRAARLQDTATDLQACARLWLRGDLV